MTNDSFGAPGGESRGGSASSHRSEQVRHFQTNNEMKKTNKKLGSALPRAKSQQSAQCPQSGGKKHRSRLHQKGPEMKIQPGAPLSRKDLEALLAEKCEGREQDKTSILQRIQIVERGPLNSPNVGEAFWTLSLDSVDLGFESINDFAEAVFGWPPGKAGRLLDWYEAERWGETVLIGGKGPVNSAVDGAADTNQSASGHGDGAQLVDCADGAFAADSCAPRPALKSDSTGSSDESAGASFQESTGTKSERPFQSEIKNKNPREPFLTEVFLNPDVPVEVPIAALDRRNAIQCRAKLNQGQVKHYKERMLAGDTFLPVEAFRIDGVLCQTDGIHRVEAAKEIGRQTILCIIRDGTRTEAIKAAIQANGSHGLPRTNSDKRNAVRLALETFGNESDHQIAELCLVSHPFVARMRKQLVTVTSCEPRMGGDGKLRRLPSKSNRKSNRERDTDQPVPQDEVGSEKERDTSDSFNEDRQEAPLTVVLLDAAILDDVLPFEALPKRELENVVLFHLTQRPAFASPDSSTWEGFYDADLFVIPTDSLSSVQHAHAKCPRLQMPSCLFLTVSVRGKIPSPDFVPNQVITGGVKTVKEVIAKMWPRAKRLFFQRQADSPITW